MSRDKPDYYPFVVTQQRDKWLIRLHDKGRKFYFGSFDTKEEAEKEARLLKDGDATELRR